MITRAAALIACLLISGMISACGNSAERSAEQINAHATEAAFLVQTEIARPTRTPTSIVTDTPWPSQTPNWASPTAILLISGTPTSSVTTSADSTPTIPSIRVTAQPGLVYFTHPAIPDYVFQIDPNHWRKALDGENAVLIHKTIMGCAIESVPGHGLAAPKRLIWQDLGLFRWEIFDYGVNAYAVPALGSGVTDGGNSFLNLQGYNVPDCRKEQETILANMMTRSEAVGELSLAPFQSPTPRPALEGFSCPNTPPARLRIGDQVTVITDGVWLRSAPQADDSTKIRKLLRNAPVNIRIVDGPVCEKYVYWQVEINTFGEASETTRGWLAEGDLQEYYLMPVK